jgi:Flagellar biosynthesis protein, FliO
VNWKHVRKTSDATEAGGLAVWLLEKWRGVRRSGGRSAPRLALVEQISLAPKQTLALVEAEGRRFLVASSVDGAPAFYPLDGGRELKARAGSAMRVSW